MVDNDWWERLSLDRIPIPEDVEADIVTPHSHEGTHNAPLWLVWKRSPLGSNPAELDFPVLDSVCDSADSARAHYRMAVYHVHYGSSSKDVVHVERVPANHSFASSLGNWQHEAHMAIWKERAARNKREGD